jgi:hypothetical protein
VFVYGKPLQPIQIFVSKARVGHLLGIPLMGMLLVLPTNIKPRANPIKIFKSEFCNAKKSRPFCSNRKNVYIHQMAKLIKTNE